MKVIIEYWPEPVRSPLSFWVHRPVDSDLWHYAKTFDPPMPGRVAGKGWPAFIVEHRGRALFFASPEEIDHAIEVLGQRVLPSNRQLVSTAGFSGYSNKHWLSRLPKFWKPWKVRLLLVDRLRAFRARH